MTVYIITMYQQNQHLSLSALSALQIQFALHFPHEKTLTCFTSSLCLVCFQYPGTNGSMATAVSQAGTARDHVEGQSR